MHKTNNKLIWYAALIIILFNSYLIFSQVITTLYYLYGLIITIAILLHILIIKNFNLNLFVVGKSSKLWINFFFVQAAVFLLAAWLVVNLLAQGELNIRTAEVSSNLMPNNIFIIICSWVNWIVIVSIVLGINVCKHYFKYPSTWTLAKCLFPSITRQPWFGYYRMLLNLEAGIKIISLITLFVILTATFFEIIANKYKLFNFFQYPVITALMIIVICLYLTKYIGKSIDVLSKKTSMDFISIFIIVTILAATIIFILNQIMLEQIYSLSFKSFNGGVISRFFNNIVVNQDRIKILNLSVNIILSACAANLLLPCANKNNIKTIYFTSSIYPVVISLTLYNPIIIHKFINVLTVDWFNILIMLLVFTILIINYTNIYSVSELIAFKSIKPTRTIKTSFNIVIKKIILGYFIILSSYYLFSWIIPMHLLAITSIFLLPAVIILLLKVLNFNHLSKY